MPPPDQPTVLLTGFDPFGGATRNPSSEAVQALHGNTLAGHRVQALELPTVFGDAWQVLRAALRQHRPALVVCVGQAGGRQGLHIERVAINLDDASIPDNAGHQPHDQPIEPGAPTAYFSSLPLQAVVTELRAQGLPAEVSNSAGTFVCNHVFYRLMHTLATDPELRGTRGGFVHVPWLPEQGSPGMELGDVVRGLRGVVEVSTGDTRITRPSTPCAKPGSSARPQPSAGSWP